jgi:thioredoxin-related protein
MKKLGLILIAAFGLAQATFAAEATWLTDLPKAQSTAKEQKKLVLMDFTGSDWCPPCKALHKNVLTSKEFEDFAKDNLVLVLIDDPHGKKLVDAMTPEQKKANAALRRKYEIQGYPTIIVLDADGKQVKQEVGYSGETSKEFVAKLQSLRK